jgi:hypothetical protein
VLFGPSNSKNIYYPIKMLSGYKISVQFPLVEGPTPLESPMTEPLVPEHLMFQYLALKRTALRQTLLTHQAFPCIAHQAMYLNGPIPKQILHISSASKLLRFHLRLEDALIQIR